MLPPLSWQASAAASFRAPRALLQRVFSRHLMDMAFLILVAVLFSGLRRPEGLFADSDIWWHMANARILDQTHHFIHVEPYSFTVAGQPWIDSQWLSEMPFWFGYKHLALVGVFVVSAIGILGNVLLIYWRGCWRQANVSVTFWVSILGILLMSVNSAARTILFAYIAMSLEMAILEAAQRGKERLIWLLPPLLCVWANLHGSWLTGILLLALYIGCGWFRIDRGIFLQVPFTPAQRNRLLAVFGLSVALLFVNPYGWRLVWIPFDMAFAQKLTVGSVQEWQPLNLAWNVGKVSVLAIALMVAAHVVRGPKWKLFDLALFFFAWYSAFAHARFTFFAAVLTMPMIAKDLTTSFFPPSKVQKTIPLMNGLIAACALLMAAQFIPTQVKLEMGIARELPLKTIAMIQPSWRTMNEDDLGGLMEFYGKPTFVDTRWETFDHHGVLKDFLDMGGLHDSLRLLDQYRIDHVLVRADEQLAYLLERTPGWVVVSREGEDSRACVLFARGVAATAAPAR